MIPSPLCCTVICQTRTQYYYKREGVLTSRLSNRVAGVSCKLCRDTDPSSTDEPAKDFRALRVANKELQYTGNKSDMSQQENGRPRVLWWLHTATNEEIEANICEPLGHREECQQ